MDQIKIGTFIKNARKEVQLTQAELAEKLGVTDRAVSKWENGKCMPDAATIPEICEILHISINELFIGEKIMTENDTKKIESTLMSLKEETEKKNRILLRVEIVLCAVAILFLIASSMITEYLLDQLIHKVLLMTLAIIVLIISVAVALSIEHSVAYYVCKDCGHIHKPTKSQILFAQHMGRARKITCPACGKKSWSKMYMSEEDAASK